MPYLVPAEVLARGSSVSWSGSGYGADGRDGGGGVAARADWEVMREEATGTGDQNNQSLDVLDKRRQERDANT